MLEVKDNMKIEFHTILNNISTHTSKKVDIE